MLTQMLALVLKCGDTCTDNMDYIVVTTLSCNHIIYIYFNCQSIGSPISTIRPFPAPPTSNICMNYNCHTTSLSIRDLANTFHTSSTFTRYYFTQLVIS